MKHKRPRRWSEDLHMLIAGTVTIALIFGAVIGFAKYGPSPAAPVVEAKK